MSNSNHLFTDDVALLAVIDPDAYSTQALTSGWVSGKNFYNYACLISVGDFSSSTCTLDATLDQATSSSGAGSKTITGKSITQFASTSDSNKQAWINLKPEELDVANDFDWFQLTVTVDGDSADCAAYVFGKDAAYGLASAGDVSTVDEIVS